MFLNSDEEKRAFEVQDDDPWWLIWVQRLIYYSIVIGGITAYGVLAIWLTQMAFDRWA